MCDYLQEPKRIRFTTFFFSNGHQLGDPRKKRSHKVLFRFTFSPPTYRFYLISLYFWRQKLSFCVQMYSSYRNCLFKIMDKIFEACSLVGHSAPVDSKIGVCISVPTTLNVGITLALQDSIHSKLLNNAKSQFQS